MKHSTKVDERDEAARAAKRPGTRAERLRAAVDRAVAVGPSFLRGDIDADEMANAMVGAVRTYAEQQRAAGDDGSPRSEEVRELEGVVAELMTCGSAYLAGCCDADCVARTMTELVRELGAR